MRGERRVVIRRKHLGIVALIALSLIAAGCHPLTNPVDPNSTTFTGERTSKDPQDLPRVLPEIVRWRIVSESTAGQMIGFDVPADGSLIEPRAPVNAPQFFVVAYFAETPTEGAFEGGLYVWAFADSSGTNVAQVNFDIFDATTNSLRLRVDTAPQVARVRIKFVDRNSRVAGDAEFSFLAGDVNGDGVVDAIDPSAVAVYDGQLADESVPATVRADVNASGVVEGAGIGDPDYDAVTSLAGSSLTGIDFPEL